MATIAALVTGVQERVRLQAAVRGRVDVVFCDSGVDLRRAAANGPLAAAIVALWDANGRSQVPAIRGFRRRLPRLPIYVCCGLEQVDAHEIAHAGRAGINDIILHGPEEAWIALEDVPGASERERAAQSVLRVTDRLVPAPAKRLFRYTLAHTRPRPTVEAAAASFGVPRSTFFAQFKATGLPAPREFVSWARLLLAGFMLEAWDRSVDQTALRAGFESGAALRGLLRRKTGLRPQELLACGGFFHLMQQFERALWIPSADHQATPVMPLQSPCTASPRVRRDETPVSRPGGNVASNKGNVA